MKVRLSIISFVAIAALALPACGTPPPGGGAAVCSGPTEVLETGSWSVYSVPRAISPSGQWLVTTRSVGVGFEVTLRGPSPTSPGSVIATIPEADYLQFAVSDDGEVVVEVNNSNVFTDRLHRIDQSTGELVPLPAPDFPLPPGALSQLVGPRLIAPGGERALWSQGVRVPQPPGSGYGISHILDVDSAEVLWSGTMHQQVFSPSLTHLLQDNAATSQREIVEVDTGEFRSLAAAYDALPGAGPFAISDNGRYVVFTTGHRALHVWDTVTEQFGPEVTLNSQRLQVSDMGRLQSIVTREHGEDIQMWDPSTERVHTLASGELVDADWGISLAAVRTPDLRTTVATMERAIPPSTEMLAIRCN